MCPPFGWEELCAHRALREWAVALAASGYSCLRVDLPGTGDSAGPLDEPASIASWASSVGDAAGWLASVCGCVRVVTIGVGFGGVLASLAAAESETIDALALWAVPSLGRDVLRELRLYGRFASPEPTSQVKSASADALEESLDVAGFTLAREAVRELHEIDLTAPPSGERLLRRVLLMGRDSRPPDRRLREHYEHNGEADVTVMPGDGYSALMSNPRDAISPEVVIAGTIAWLDGWPPDERAPHTRRNVREVDRIEVLVGGRAVREAPFEFRHDGKRLAGVMAELRDGGAAPFCALLLNAGAIRRIGPSRIWVETARSWAALGVPSLRLDALGIGDSDEAQHSIRTDPDFYRDGFIDQVDEALRALGAAGYPETFVVAGLCASAHWALHTALRPGENRVRALMLINLPTFARQFMALPARNDEFAVRSRDRLRESRLGLYVRRADRRGSDLARMVTTTARALLPAPRLPSVAEIWNADAQAVVARLAGTGIRTTLLLAEREPLLPVMADPDNAVMLEQAHITVGVIPTVDHTVRSILAQRYVSDMFDRSMHELIEVCGQG